LWFVVGGGGWGWGGGGLVLGGGGGGGVELTCRKKSGDGQKFPEKNSSQTRVYREQGLSSEVTARR